MTKFVNPDQLPESFGYSHVVDTRGQRTVYVSGQVGMNAHGEMVSATDFEAQARQAFTNVQQALESVGLNFGHVVKLGLFVLDVSHLAVLRRVRDEFVNLEQPPASTLIQVAAFFRPDVLFEVDAIAVEAAQ
jgi:enamine deaminase RidA (YjgF/YER057c/UK114 family)